MNFAQNCVEHWMFGLQWASSVLPRDFKVKKMQKEQKSARLLAIQWIKRWKTGKIVTVSKFKILQKQMKKGGFSRVTCFGTRPRFTVQSARQNCLVTGQSSIWSCKFCIVKCIDSIYGKKNVNSFKTFSTSFIENLSVKERWLIQKIIKNVGKNVLPDSNKKVWLVWHKHVPDL